MKERLMTTNSAAPQKLYLFRLATATITVGDRSIPLVQGCYLIETGDGKHILIDSGLPENHPAPSMGAAPKPEKNVIEHLAALGLRPEDIDLLICTHFDSDHSGYHDAFPQAELIVQREHYTLARGGHPRYATTREHWDHPALRYRLLDGDTDLLPGLTLLETSGHALGHQSVLVRLPHTGPVLLAIDAVILARLFTPERSAGPLDDNEEQLRASTRKLLDVQAREHAALVIFGHDGQQWETLKRSPEYYD
jgi:N-acyl homoserine lactone hydrolase